MAISAFMLLVLERRATGTIDKQCPSSVYHSEWYEKIARAFGSEFFRTVDLGQQYDTVSHVGGIVFHSIQQSTFGVSHSA